MNYPMKVQLFDQGMPFDEPFVWPTILSEDEPLAEPEIYRAVTELEVGDEVKVGRVSVRRVSL